MRQEQLFVHMRIYAFCAAHAPTKPPENNENTEDTMRGAEISFFPQPLMHFADGLSHTHEIAYVT